MTPQHLHGRMMGATESLAALSLALGLPLGGVLVSLSSPRVAFLIMGLGTFLTTAAFVRLTLMGLDPKIESLDVSPQTGAQAPTSGVLPHEPAS
jgi:MFS family permease